MKVKGGGKVNICIIICEIGVFIGISQSSIIGIVILFTKINQSFSSYLLTKHSLFL